MHEYYIISAKDSKKGKMIIVYGVLADIQGRPIAVEVYPGNTSDPTTVPDQVKKLRKRQDILKATEKEFEKIARQVARRTKKALEKAEIGQKVGKVKNRYKMGKHFDLTIDDGVFRYKRREESIKRESDLDGIYVIRTSEPNERLSAEDTVRSYKNLSCTEARSPSAGVVFPVVGILFLKNTLYFYY